MVFIWWMLEIQEGLFCSGYFYYVYVGGGDVFLLLEFIWYAVGRMLRVLFIGVIFIIVVVINGGGSLLFFVGFFLEGVRER